MAKSNKAKSPAKAPVKVAAKPMLVTPAKAKPVAKAPVKAKAPAKAVALPSNKPVQRAKPMTTAQMTAWSNSFNKSSARKGRTPVVRPPVVTPPVRPPVVTPPVVTPPGVTPGARSSRRSNLTLTIPGAMKPQNLRKTDLPAARKSVKKAVIVKRTEKPSRPERSATKPRVVEKKEVLHCKARPETNRPKPGGGGGGKRFIPWC